jgi:3-methyladenine DNA glycosylase AlkD
MATDLVGRIVTALEAARNPSRAAPMAAYLRDQFPFLGIPTPERTVLVRDALAGTAPLTAGDLLDSVDALWALDEREYQLVAAALLVRYVRLLPPSSLPRIERLIITRSWWDTVDALAIHVVGGLVRADRSLATVMDGWIDHENLWLARTAILHQNRWKAETDQERLFRYCLSRSADREFFIRKAIGWALREYSKTEPDAVRRFVGDHPELSGLSRREALKWLDRPTTRHPTTHPPPA